MCGCFGKGLGSVVMLRSSSGSRGSGHDGLNPLLHGAQHLSKAITSAYEGQRWKTPRGDDLCTVAASRDPKEVRDIKC